MTLNSAPGKKGYFFPPEWHSHQATWLSWPHNLDTWRGDIDSIFMGYTHFVKEITKSELVCINVNDKSMETAALERLVSSGVPSEAIRFFHHPTNDAWCRDHGPMFLKNAKGDKLVVNWGFNAWGEKYPPYHLDNAVPDKVADALQLPLYIPDMVLEGGSVDFNGYGTVLTTSTCLLNPNRNPKLNRSSAEEQLKEVFGISQVLWLENGIAGDDTDGHIDTVTRFVSEDTVVTVLEEDPTDENHAPLRENLEALKSMKLWNGLSLKVITLPMPKPLFHNGQRLPASYANFYICNQSVLVPTFKDSNDQKALSLLAGVFTDKRIVGIDCSEIIRGLGALHCLCMQEPVGSL